MPLRPIYSVSAASNAHCALVLRNAAAVPALTQRAWGTPLTSDWQTLELTAAPATASRGLADISALYFPGLLVATDAAAAALPLQGVEVLPACLEGQALFLLNPLSTIRRFREEGARCLRVPSGALVFLEAADFYAEDLSDVAPIFWLHDGNAARYLLCGEAFVQSVSDARLNGVHFTRLGHVLP